MKHKAIQKLLDNKDEAYTYLKLNELEELIKEKAGLKGMHLFVDFTENSERMQMNKKLNYADKCYLKLDCDTEILKHCGLCERAFTEAHLCIDKNEVSVDSYGSYNAWVEVQIKAKAWDGYEHTFSLGICRWADVRWEALRFKD